MNKIITSEETDIDFDPESIADEDENSSFKDRTKRLEAIRDLEAMLDNVESNISQVKKEDKSINCFMRVQTKHTKNAFNMNFKLVSLNQTVIERTSVELELEAPQKRLLSLFNFYQKNIVKQKRKTTRVNALRLFLKKGPKPKKRKRITSNDVYITKIYARINEQKLTLIDCENDIWRINEMKYVFDNNRPTIRVLLLRNK